MLHYKGLGDCAKAREIARGQIGKPRFPSDSYFTGVVFEACGSLEDARKTWSATASLLEAELRETDQYRKRAVLALIYAKLGRTNNSMEQIRRALSLNPEHPWTLFFAAVAHSYLGNSGAALKYLHQAVDRGWLQLSFFTFNEQPCLGFHALRDDPEYRRLRDEVARKVEDLRKTL